MNLDQDQAGAVALSRSNNKVLCVAGAGSGKTTTLVEAIAAELTEGASVCGIVAITFTNAGAKVIRDRLEARGVHIAFCGTLHGFMGRLARTRYERLVALPEEDSEAVLVEVMAALKVPKAKLKEIKAARRSWWKREAGKLDSATERVLFAYYRALQADGLTDYDGILYEGWRVIKEMTAAELPGKIFVDEFQDSSEIDVAIYDALMEKGVRLFVCGDPDQAIYGFRGSDVAGIVGMGNRLDFAVARLENNYRCRSAIAEAATRLVSHNTLRIPKVTRAVTAGGSVVAEHVNTGDEQNYVAADIVARFIETVPAEQVAVLVRTNAMARDAAAALEAKGIPTCQKVTVPLPKDWSVVRRLLALLCQPDNWRLGKFYMVAIGKTVPSWQMADIMKLTPFQFFGLPVCRTVEDALNALASEGVCRETIFLIRDLLSEVPCGTIPELQALLCGVGDVTKSEGEGVYVGTIHCSPPDEPVLTTRGYKQICELNPEFDRLLSYNSKCNQLTRGRNYLPGRGAGYEFKVKYREYQGPMLTLKTATSLTRVTPEHRVRVRYSSRFYGKWVVYLMRRGNWWRVGMTQSASMPYKSGGIPGRLATEKGDEAWLLGIYESRRDAILTENYIQALYGITSLRFEGNKNAPDCQWSSEELQRVHESLVSSSNKAALKILKAYNLLRDSPLFTRGVGARRAMSDHWFTTVAANVLSGYMEIPVADISDFDAPAPCKPRRALVTVSRAPYKGLVYSLDVIPYQHYISGGAIVHNSAKGREWHSVLVLGCEEGVLPFAPRTDEGIEKLEEDRRLMFVAMTRAEERLVLLSSSCRIQKFGNFAQRVDSGRSRFIAEAGL